MIRQTDIEVSNDLWRGNGGRSSRSLPLGPERRLRGGCPQRDAHKRGCPGRRIRTPSAMPSPSPLSEPWPRGDKETLPPPRLPAPTQTHEKIRRPMKDTETRSNTEYCLRTQEAILKHTDTRSDTQTGHEKRYSNTTQTRLPAPTPAAAPLRARARLRAGPAGRPMEYAASGPAGRPRLPDVAR